MHPALRPYYDHVIPVFWPWLWLNLIRFALWHLRTGHEALLAVDCFGNIRMVHLADEPKPVDLYTYEAPRVPRWESPALGSDLPASAPSFSYSVFIASLSGVYAVLYVVRERVRGPPQDHPPLRSGGGVREADGGGARRTSGIPPPSASFAVCHLPRKRWRIRVPHRTAPAAPAFRAARNLQPLLKPPLAHWRDGNLARLRQLSRQ